MTDRQNLRFCTSSDGVGIAYATTGQGPALVKAANWLTHLEHDRGSPMWHHWIEELSAGRTFVRYDSRGCGLSDREPAEISFEAWVRDLEAVVDEMKLERFPLIALSQGASIAVAYAVRHPERVTHLVICGGFARGRLRREPSPEKVDEALVYHKLAEIGWGTDNASFRQVFAAQLMPDCTREELLAFDEMQRLSTSARNAVRYMQVSDLIDVTALASRVACPTLVMHARGDQRVPFEEGRKLAMLIPDARFVALESRNHVLMQREPAWKQFVTELRAFVPSAGGGAHAFDVLTQRERELLGYLARGLDNHQIAAHLELSEKTVRNHVSSIFAKLGVESRAQAVVMAREAGFGLGTG